MKAALHGSPHSTDTGATMSAILHSTLDRFWAKVQKTDTCWLWTAAINPKGYGQFKHGNMVYAHRFSYEQAKGPIPKGLQIDHLCRVRHCVNPDHLEAVSRRTNILRGEGFAAKQHRQTHCKNGHLLIRENIYVNKEGHRRCKICHSINRKQKRRKTTTNQKEQTQ